MKQHVLWSEETVRIEGSIRTVSAEDQTQFVLFELDAAALKPLQPNPVVRCLNGKHRPRPTSS